MPILRWVIVIILRAVNVRPVVVAALLRAAVEMTADRPEGIAEAFPAVRVAVRAAADIVTP
jgi:hypothetical protein